MTDQYRHTKGIIQDNAIAALLNDPLFRQRREKNLKGKGSYCRKGKNARSRDWEGSGKIILGDFTTTLLSANAYLISRFQPCPANTVPAQTMYSGLFSRLTGLLLL